MNKDLNNFIEKIKNECFNIFIKLIENHGLQYNSTLTFYPNYPREIEGIEYPSDGSNCVSPVIRSVFNVKTDYHLSTVFDLDSILPPIKPSFRMSNDEIISDIISDIYMDHESLYMAMIECNLDYDSIIKYLSFFIRHEIGHLIYFRTSYQFKRLSSWNSLQESIKKQYDEIPDLCEDASYDDRLKWYLDYYHLDVERKANDAIGIDDNDITEMVNLSCSFKQNDGH